MYTEDEAKTKWCPQARFTFSDRIGSAGNKFGQYTPADTECVCIASDCMMWRWGDEPEHEGLAEYRANPRGYCGLGGKP